MKRLHDFYDKPRKKLSPYDFTDDGRLCDEHEDRVAKKMKGKKQPASGALPMHKGDILAGNFLVEAKTSGKKSIRVSQHWLEKISSEAMQTNKTPVLALGFPNMPIPYEQDWVMLSLKEFNKLRGE